MREQDLIDLLEEYKRTESEIIEFKEWKTSIPFTSNGKKEKDNKKCVYGYCVGIGNEGGGKLIIGVSNNGTIVGTEASLKSDAKKWIYEKTKQKIGIYNIQTSKGKVIVIDIPSRQISKLLKFWGAPLMRVDDSLTEMDDITIKKIVNETKIDRSGLPCKGTVIDDLDENAILFLKSKKAEITKDESYRNVDTKTFLNQMSLLTEKGVPNHTCILFLGKQSVAEKKLPAISRLLRLYIDEKNGYEDRLTIEQQRSPLIITLGIIIEKIKKYNFPLEDITLFRQDPEYQYSEKAIEELLANSLAHRDWTIQIHNEVRQSPESLIFTNPGIFESDLEKVLEYSYITPYKNQTMADFLSKINLMENERRGLQKVFSDQLSRGVFVHKEEIDNNAGGIVRMILDGKIKDKDFAKLVLQKKDISRLNLFLLQKISEGENIVGKSIHKDHAEKMRRLGYIELYGRGNNRKCRISYDLLNDIGQVEKYILDKGIGTKKKEQLIMEYLEKKGSISTTDLYRLFPEGNKNSLRVLLMNMKKKGFIKKIKDGLYKLT